MKALLTLLLALAATGSYAQQATVSIPPALTATHADSVATIRQAFRRARRLGRFGTFAEGNAVGINMAILLSGQLRDAPGKRALSISSTVIYAGFLAVFLKDWLRFSKARENQAVQRFELHQPQPLYVQRRLATYAVRQEKK